MKLHRILKILVPALLMAVALPGFTTEKIWVSSFDAKLKADRTASSETLAILTVGTELLVESQVERWYRVAAPGGKIGWIYRGKVSSEPPGPSGQESEGDSVGKLLTGLTGSRIGSEKADTSRSMRMLSVEHEKKKAGSASEQAHDDALESVLSRRISDDRIDQFLQAGKIGEYAP